MHIFFGLSGKFMMKALLVACGVGERPAEALVGDKPDRGRKRTWNKKGQTAARYQSHVPTGCRCTPSEVDTNIQQQTLSPRSTCEGCLKRVLELVLHRIVIFQRPPLVRRPSPHEDTYGGVLGVDVGIIGHHLTDAFGKVHVATKTAS